MRILDILNSPWAISHKRLNEILNIYRLHFRGEKIDWKAIQSGIQQNNSKPENKTYQIINGIAVINIVGVLNKNDAFMSWLYDGTMMNEVAAAYRAAVADPQVKSIILSIDSPGGTVDGTQELANIIYSEKNGKQVIAYCDGMIASAAYWIGSAADKIYISGDTVEVGSIGVVCTHIDYSEQDKQFGEKWNEITAGKYKRIASAHTPLSDEGRQVLQDQVDHIYSVFVDEVARNRNVSVEDALKMADGKIFIGKQAVEVGLVDGVATIGQIINSMSAGAPINFNAQEEIMDIKELMAKHPDLYQAVLSEGSNQAQSTVAAQIQAKIGEGMIYGAALENERIKSVMAQAVPGHEAIIQAAIADGKSTAGEVAIRIIAADKTLRQAKGADAAADAAGLSAVAAVAAPAIVAPAAADENLPVEEKAKKAWDSDSKLREEFKLGGYAAYLAYMKNEGNIRILKKG